MGILEIIIPIVIGFGGIYLHNKFEDKDREISDLKEELGQTKRKLESAISSKEWLEKSHEDLIEKYEMLLGRYNPPPRWWEAEEEQDCEDAEDEQMAEIFVKGKFGTRVEKVPAKYVNFKRRN